jgi:hypothetical protein
MHAVDFVDGDLPEQLDRDCIGVDRELMARAQIKAYNDLSAISKAL